MFISTAYAATTEAVQHGAELGEKSGVFPPFDPSTFSSQLLWLALTFGFFYLFMARVVLPRIGNILEDRRDRISQDLLEAQRLKEETEASIAAYEQELAEARHKAHTIAGEANEKSRAAGEAERAKIEAELAEKLAEAETHISNIRDSAMGEVSAIASDTAEAIVTRLIGGKISKAELTKAISLASK
jgi:F-type H+-transporting ATPase subunit b